MGIFLIDVFYLSFVLQYQEMLGTCIVDNAQMSTVLCELEARFGLAVTGDLEENVAMA